MRVRSYWLKLVLGHRVWGWLVWMPVSNLLYLICYLKRCSHMLSPNFRSARQILSWSITQRGVVCFLGFFFVFLLVESKNRPH